MTSSGDNSAQEAGNSFYLDGVYLRIAPNNYDLVDMSRIEVVRGPQGTMFGRNTMTGAINYVTHKPEAGNHNWITASAGNNNAVKLRGMSNLQLHETLFMRLSYSLREEDGDYHNQFDQQDVGNDHSRYGRAQLRWQADDKLSANLSLDYHHEENRNIQAVLRTPTTAASQAALDYWGTTVAGLSPDQIPTSSYNINQDQYRDPDIYEHWGSNFSVVYNIDDQHQLSYTGARRSAMRDSSRDDEDMLAVFLVNTPDVERSLLSSHEFRINGEYAYWNWVSGLYYEDINISADQSIEVSPLGIDDFIALFNLPPQGQGASVPYETDFNTESLAWYGNINVTLMEKLTLTSGLRLTYEKKDLHYRQNGGCWTNPGGSLTQLFGGCFYPQLDVHNDNNDTGISASAGISYQFTPSLMLYSTLSSGYRSSGFDANLKQINSAAIAAPIAYQSETITDLDLSFEAEDLISFEFGAKYHAADMRLLLDVGFFYSQYDNLQVSQFVDKAFDTNSGKAIIQGSELELKLQPITALQLTGRAAYLNAKYDRFVTDTADYSGNTLTNAPRWNYSLISAVTQTLATQLQLSVVIDYSYEDERFNNPNNDSDNYLSASNWLLNSRIGLEYLASQFGAYLWAKNLTNEQYEMNNRMFESLGIVKTNLNQPRSYGIEVIARF